MWGGIRGALPEPIKAPFYELIIILTPAWGPGGSLAGAKEQQKLAHPYRTDILDPLSHCEPWLDWMSSTRKTQTPCPVHVHDSKWIPESAPGGRSNDWYHSWSVQLVWCLKSSYHPPPGSSVIEKETIWRLLFHSDCDNTIWAFALRRSADRTDLNVSQIFRSRNILKICLLNHFKHTTVALLQVLELEVHHELHLVTLHILLRASCWFFYCVYLPGLHCAVWWRCSFTDKRTTSSRMHSVQEELSGHLYFKVKRTLTTSLLNNCRFKWLLWCQHHSAADSLGPVWGVHIWHDNSGSSPSWYLKQVEVCEVSRGCLWTCCFLLLRFLIDGHLIGVQVSPGPENKWLFVAQCWLAVDKDDGRVERMLRVCERGITFAEVLRRAVHLCLRVLSYVTFYPNLILCSCCSSSCKTTWQTITSGCQCSAAPIRTHSLTRKGFVLACCYCWDILLSTLLSYCKWRIK